MNTNESTNAMTNQYPEQYTSVPPTELMAQPVNPVTIQPNNPFPTKFCKYCGTKIPMDAVICTACGRQVEMLAERSQPMPQVVIHNSTQSVSHANASATASAGAGRKSVNKWVSFWLCLLLGYFGAHKFYEGKAGMGLLYLFTFGLCGIGWIIDTIAILFKPNPYYV